MDPRRYLAALFIITFYVACDGSRNKAIFNEIYKTYKKMRDPTSFPNLKITQLYSKTAKFRVQVFPGSGRVVAQGENMNKYATLHIFTTSYSSVLIKGAAADRYICLDRRGHLISRKRETRRCGFNESYDGEGFLFYESLVQKGKYIAFDKNGKPQTRNSFRGENAKLLERSITIKRRFYKSKGRVDTGCSKRPQKKHTRRMTTLGNNPRGFVVLRDDKKSRKTNKDGHYSRRTDIDNPRGFVVLRNGRKLKRFNDRDARRNGCKQDYSQKKKQKIQNGKWNRGTIRKNRKPRRSPSKK